MKKNRRLIANTGNRKWLLLISFAAIVMFLVVFFSNVYEVQEYEKSSRFRTNLPDSYNMFDITKSGSRPTSTSMPYRMILSPASVPMSYRMILSPVLLMIATVFAAYYFISRRLEEKLENNIKVISRLMSKKDVASGTGHKNSADKNIILKFLNPSERNIVEMLVQGDGESLQSEISRTGEMNKLRVHRTVKDLERKNIIKVEKYGKTNRITLSEDVENILLK